MGANSSHGISTSITATAEAKAVVPDEDDVVTPSASEDKEKQSPVKKAQTDSGLLPDIAVQSAAIVQEPGDDLSSETLEGILLWSKATWAALHFLNPPHVPAAEAQRLRLLLKAIRKKDLFFLALHQVYCLSSVSSSSEKRVTAPGFSVDNGPWVEVIKQLLLVVENRKSPSEKYIRQFAQFPCPWDRLVQSKDYQTVLQQVSHTLSLISQNWARFEHEVLLRRYPPLLEELISQFGITSRTFQSVIAKAFVRRLYIVSNDRMANQILWRLSKELFEWDRKTHEKSADPDAQGFIRQWKEGLMEGYMRMAKAFPLKASPQRPGVGRRREIEDFEDSDDSDDSLW